MSRYYQMTCSAWKLQTGEADMIREALAEEWSWENYYEDASKTKLNLSGRDSLCGGESEEDFSARISRAIWARLGRYIPMEITCTYMENLPYRSYHPDGAHYAAWMENSKPTQ